MTRFKDGPAAGKNMMLRRAVVFLRVTRLPADPQNRRSADKWDALDQPDDTPEPDEELFAYKHTGQNAGMCHVRMSGKAKGGSGFYAIAEYALCDPQPSDEEMRDVFKWRAWCERQPK